MMRVICKIIAIVYADDTIIEIVYAVIYEKNACAIISRRSDITLFNIRTLFPNYMNIF